MRYCLSDTGLMPFDLVLLSGGCLLDQCVVFRQTERRPRGCGNDGRGANPSCLHPCRQAAGALALRDSARWVYLGAPLAISGPRETLATRQEKALRRSGSSSVIKTREAFSALPIHISTKSRLVATTDFILHVLFHTSTCGVPFCFHHLPLGIIDTMPQAPWEGGRRHLADHQYAHAHPHAHTPHRRIRLVYPTCLAYLTCLPAHLASQPPSVGGRSRRSKSGPLCLSPLPRGMPRGRLNSPST